MTKHPSDKRRLMPAVIAGVTAIALTGGATQAGAAGTSATAIKETTSTVDRAWNKKSDRIQERYSVRTRVANGRATLTDRRGNRLGVSITGLRRGADTRTFGRTTLFKNGLGMGVDAAVQRTDTGVRMMSVIRTATAPTTYRYPMRLPRGAKLARQASGVVLIRNASGSPIGVVRRPWAIDARGTRVTTSFVVRGRTLVQRVAHRGAAYPVVADPSIDFGLTSATLTLNPQDQRILLSTGGTIVGGAIGALLCSGSGPGAVVCALVGAGLGTALFETIKEYGVKENCDVKVRIGYFPPHIDNIWREGSGC